MEFKEDFLVIRNTVVSKSKVTLLPYPHKQPLVNNIFAVVTSRGPVNNVELEYYHFAYSKFYL